MSVIETEELLSEIAADAPCGEDLEYARAPVRRDHYPG
ncbi:MAG: hypothetical protein H6R23_277 [Proteobacteria bacterium]|nr:hypothetical protein [Pseudomonadota bacterium]